MYVILCVYMYLFIRINIHIYTYNCGYAIRVELPTLYCARLKSANSTLWIIGYGAATCMVLVYFGVGQHIYLSAIWIVHEPLIFV